MPDPTPGENRGEFTARCMGDPESVRDFPDQAQRFAFCSSKWQQSRTKTRAAKARMTEATDDPEVLTIEVSSDQDGQLRQLIEHVGSTAAIGHSFSVVVDPGDPDYERTFGFDGDGAFRAKLKEAAKTAGGSLDELVEEVYEGRRKKRKREDASPDMTRALEAGNMTGAHLHKIAADRSATEDDGAHRHVFRLPTGELVMTDEDGDHVHGDSGAAAPHTHQITLPDGTVLTTEPEDSHRHTWLVGTTTWDGVHGHLLALPGEAPRRSLSPEELAVEAAAPEPAAQEAARTPLIPIVPVDDHSTEGLADLPRLSASWPQERHAVE